MEKTDSAFYNAYLRWRETLEFGYTKHGHPHFDNMNDYVDWEINRLSLTEFMSEISYYLTLDK